LLLHLAVGVEEAAAPPARAVEGAADQVSARIDAEAIAVIAPDGRVQRPHVLAQERGGDEGVERLRHVAAAHALDAAVDVAAVAALIGHRVEPGALDSGGDDGGIAVEPPFGDLRRTAKERQQRDGQREQPDQPDVKRQRGGPPAAGSGAGARAAGAGHQVVLR
jgi:hypothetical protein